MDKCFVVVHRNYADGVDATAFWTEADANAAVKDDVEMVVANLKEQGYGDRTRILEGAAGSREVYVADLDIYYEWEIIPTVIVSKGGTQKC